MASLFERVIAALFGGTGGNLSQSDQQLVDDLTETIVDTVEPRVRARPGYRAMLAGGIQRTIEHLRAIGREPFEVLLLARANWARDPRINAFFATADDVPACIGRSQEVRRFFEQHAECNEAFALLGMKRDEKTILAPRLEGEMLKHDVAQVAVSFSGHRLLAPSIDLASMRLEIGRRIVDRLAQLALARILELDSKATALQQHKGYLGTRLRVLNLARDGMEGLVSDPATIEQQIREVERELKQTVEDYVEAKSSIATLDGHIEQINAVLTQPAEHVALTHTRLRLNRMGIKVEPGSNEAAEDLDFTDLSIGQGLRATIALVRIPRDELPPIEDLMAQAARYL